MTQTRAIAVRPGPMLMRFAVRSVMKIVSAACLSLVLIASSAVAETEYRSTMSGTVKIEMKDAKGQAAPKAGETLTIQVVQPPKAPEADEENAAQRLKACGEKWNTKLAAYEKRLPKLKKYLAYYDSFAGFAAQQPPKSPEIQLTRADYRACMYACLQQKFDRCPGGWVAEESAANGRAGEVSARLP